MHSLPHTTQQLMLMALTLSVWGNAVQAYCRYVVL